MAYPSWPLILFQSSSPPGRLSDLLSAAGLAGMTTAALPFPYLDKVVAEDEIKFAVKRHRG